MLSEIEVYDRLKTGPWPLDALVRINEPFLDADDPGDYWFTIAAVWEHVIEDYVLLQLIVLWGGPDGRPATRPLVVFKPPVPGGQNQVLDVRDLGTGRRLRPLRDLVRAD